MDASATALMAENISYSRGGRKILDALSLRVAAGESLALMGPSGSGKTSLLAVLAGLEEPDAGGVRRSGPTRDGLILQGYGLVGVLTAAENVEIPLQARTFDAIGKAGVRERAAAALESVGLDGVAGHLVEELSGGQRQRVAVARALALDPTALFADELTSELDHEWKETIIRLVLGIAERGGIVVIATHDPAIAQRCSRTLQLGHHSRGRHAAPE